MNILTTALQATDGNALLANTWVQGYRDAERFAKSSDTEQELPTFATEAEQQAYYDGYRYFSVQWANGRLNRLLLKFREA